MPISDKKKSHAFINALGEEAQRLDVVATRLENLRSAWIAQSVSPAGTSLDGKVTAVSNWIDAIRAVADNATANGLIAEMIPTHGTSALEA